MRSIRVIQISILILLSFHSLSQLDNKTKNIIKAKFLSAESLYDAGDYSMVLLKIGEINEISANVFPRVLNLEIKTNIKQGNYALAKQKLEILYNSQLPSDLLIKISEYESEIEDGLEKEFKQKKQDEIRAIEKERELAIEKVEAIKREKEKLIEEERERIRLKELNDEKLHKEAIDKAINKYEEQRKAEHLTLMKNKYPGLTYYPYVSNNSDSKYSYLTFLDKNGNDIDYGSNDDIKLNSRDNDNMEVRITWRISPDWQFKTFSDVYIVNYGEKSVNIIDNKSLEVVGENIKAREYSVSSVYYKTKNIDKYLAVFAENKINKNKLPTTLREIYVYGNGNSILAIYTGTDDYWFHNDKAYKIKEKYIVNGWECLDNCLVAHTKKNKVIILNNSLKRKSYLVFDMVKGFNHITRESVVKIKNQYGVINENVKYVIPLGKYEEIVINEFANSYSVKNKNGQWGMIDKYENVLIEPIFEELGPIFNDGITYYREGKKYGLINSKGEIITKPIYDGIRIDNNVEGICVVLKDGKVGAIDSEGKEIAPCQYNTHISTSFGGYVCFAYTDRNNFDRNNIFWYDYKGREISGIQELIKSHPYLNDYKDLIDKNDGVNYLISPIIR